MPRKLLGVLMLFSLLFSSMVITSGVAAKPSGDEAGKSSIAKACQAGKWMHLARQGSAGVAFISQAECVSFGVQGGEIVPFVADRSISMTWSLSVDALSCTASPVFVGFEPGEDYEGTFSWSGFSTGTSTVPLTIDSDGTSTAILEVPAGGYVDYIFTVDGIDAEGYLTCRAG